MTANDLREIVRDLESGRSVHPDRVRRAVEFASDVAEVLDSLDGESDDEDCPVLDDLAMIYFKMYGEATP